MFTIQSIPSDNWRIFKGKTSGSWMLKTAKGSIFSRGSFEEIIALARYLKRGQIEAQKGSVRSVSDSTGFSGNRASSSESFRSLRSSNTNQCGVVD